MNVLVLAPHPDDETLGCGGTLCLHQQQGHRVVVVYLTSGELGLKSMPREKAWAVREEEARNAARLLGIAELHFLRKPDWMVNDHIQATGIALRTILQAEKPGIVYLPHEADGHPDHGVAFQILREALEGSHIQPTVRAYEVWSPLPAFDHVEDITAVMQRKLEALREHRSQLAGFDYERAVLGLNAYRGELAAKARYAEVFQTLHLNLKAGDE